MSGTTHGQGDNSQPDEVGASHEIGDFVELECESDREADQLVCNRDDQRDG